MRYTNPQLVAKCEQMLCMTSCEQFDERAAKSKFVAKADPLSTIRNKLIAEGEKLELGVSQGESVCIEYVVAAFKAEIYEIRVCFSHFAACRIAQHIHFFFVVHVEWTACVQRNLKVCINKEPLLWSLQTWINGLVTWIKCK